MSEPLRIDWF